MNNMDFSNVMFVVEGILTGSIAIFIYMGKKHMDARSMKRDLATMLIVEMQHNKDVLYANKESGEQLPFRRESYLGLLSNANIRYFEIKIQLMLQNLDNKLTKYLGSYVLDDFDDVVTILEKIKYKNTHTQYCKCIEKYHHISHYANLIYCRFKTSSKYKAQNCIAMSGWEKNDNNISSPI